MRELEVKVASWIEQYQHVLNGKDNDEVIQQLEDLLSMNLPVAPPVVADCEKRLLTLKWERDLALLMASPRVKIKQV